MSLEVPRTIRSLLTRPISCDSRFKVRFIQLPIDFFARLITTIRRFVKSALNHTGTSGTWPDWIVSKSTALNSLVLEALANDSFGPNSFDVVLSLRSRVSQTYFARRPVSRNWSIAKLEKSRFRRKNRRISWNEIIGLGLKVADVSIWNPVKYANLFLFILFRLIFAALMC